MNPRSEKEKMLAGELYLAFGEELLAERQRAKALCRRFNSTTEEQMPEREALLRELLGSVGAGPFIEPNFRCDYGYNIHLGDHFYANYDLVILDVGEVRIGHNCLIGPRVSILAASHPLDPATRLSGREFGRPVTIGDNVWIGAHVVINPGVSIGDNAVVGSGAVVTRDVPAGAVVAGVPARVIRPPTPS